MSNRKPDPDATNDLDTFGKVTAFKTTPQVDYAEMQRHMRYFNRVRLCAAGRPMGWISSTTVATPGDLPAASLHLDAALYVRERRRTRMGIITWSSATISPVTASSIPYSEPLVPGGQGGCPGADRRLHRPTRCGSALLCRGTGHLHANNALRRPSLRLQLCRLLPAAFPQAIP